MYGVGTRKAGLVKSNVKANERRERDLMQQYSNECMILMINHNI